MPSARIMSSHRSSRSLPVGTKSFPNSATNSRMMVVPARPRRPRAASVRIMPIMVKSLRRRDRLNTRAMCRLCRSRHCSTRKVRGRSGSPARSKIVRATEVRGGSPSTWMMCSGGSHLVCRNRPIDCRWLVPKGTTTSTTGFRNPGSSSACAAARPLIAAFSPASSHASHSSCSQQGGAPATTSRPLARRVNSPPLTARSIARRVGPLARACPVETAPRCRAASARTTSSRRPVSIPRVSAGGVTMSVSVVLWAICYRWRRKLPTERRWFWLVDGAAAGVFDLLLAGGDPRHHRSQVRPDLLDRVLAAGLEQLVEPLAATTGLGDPLVGERARLDLGQDPAHLRPGLVGDDPRAPGHVAVLGGVGDRVAHAPDPLLVHEVDDELHLVQALEVRRLRLVPGVDERLEPGLDERRQPAAQHDLL